MKSYHVFAGMGAAQAQRFFDAIAEEAPGLLRETAAAAAPALKVRPAFLARQKGGARQRLLKQALSRIAMNAMAEQVLAAYFVDLRLELLSAWLDALGIEHEDGILREEAPQEPPAEKLKEAVATFRAAAGDDAGAAEDRELLLRAFAAQGAIDWPELEALLPAGKGEAGGS